MPSFSLSKDRVNDAVNTIIQFLRDSGYDGSVEDGTGISDVVIKPSAVIYELMAQLADRTSAYQSLQRARELEDTIGTEEYDHAVDCVLSNWFVTRNEGKPSRGLVRLWFLKPMDFLSFTDGSLLATVEAYNLLVDGDQIFTESNFSCVLNTAENQNEYYVDVLVRTEDLTDFTPEDGAKVYAAYKDVYFIRAETPSTFTAGSGVESSEDFIRRTEVAITTRELITDRAIQTVLLDAFDDIIRIYVARHGSGEQLRDVVNFQNVTVHVGNKADIYIASELTKMEFDVFTDEEGNIDTSQLPVSSVVCCIADSNLVTENPDRSITLTPCPLEISCEETRYGSFGYTLDKMTAPGITEVSTIRLTLLCDPVLRSIHEFVYSEEQRVACYDPMVKHMFPCVVRPTVRVSLTDPTIDSSAAVKASIVAYIRHLVATGEPWVASELVTRIHTEVPNVKKIFLPIESTGEIFDPLTSRKVVFPLSNQFSISADAPPMSLQVTDNTVQFYTDVDLVQVEAG